MAIFYGKLCLPELSLYYPYQHVIMLTYKNGNKEDWSHDHNAGGILHCRRASKTSQSIKRNNHRLAQEGRYSLVQGWAAVARESHRFREVHGESAQSIASWEAQNVRSLPSNSLPDILDDRPGTTIQAFQLVCNPFVFIVQRFAVICNDLARFTVEQGGKCDVMTIINNLFCASDSIIAIRKKGRNAL